jgi:Na+/H+-translocating membrane pyrophosphatase
MPLQQLQSPHFPLWGVGMRRAQRILELIVIVCVVFLQLFFRRKRVHTHEVARYTSDNIKCILSAQEVMLAAPAQNACIAHEPAPYFESPSRMGLTISSMALTIASHVYLVFSTRTFAENASSLDSQQSSRMLGVSLYTRFWL